MKKKVGRPTLRQGPKTSRLEIIHAAATLVGKLGAAGTSYRKIAQEAGVSLSTVQHYFPKKKDLWKSVVDELIIPAENIKNEYKTIEDLFSFIIDKRLKNLSKTPGLSSKFLTENSVDGDSLLIYLAESIKEIRGITREKIEASISNKEIRKVNVDALLALTGIAVPLLTSSSSALKVFLGLDLNDDKQVNYLSKGIIDIVLNGIKKNEILNRG